MEILFTQIISARAENRKGNIEIDDYVKNDGPERSDLRSLHHESLRTWIKTTGNKFAISNHTALILGMHALRSYLKLMYECELHSLPNKKLSVAKDDGKNYIKIRPPLVRHLLRTRLFYPHSGMTIDNGKLWSIEF